MEHTQPQSFAAVVIQSTVPDMNLAKRIAHLLLEEGLAACIQVNPGVLSMYTWEGDVRGEQEVSLTIKTTENVVTAVIERLVALHPYQVPEAIVLPVIAGFGPYLDWIQANTRK